MGEFEKWLYLAVGSALGFFGKSLWNGWLKQRAEFRKVRHTKRLSFLERQLTELYWPLYAHLQRDNAVWTYILSRTDADTAASALGTEVESAVILPNHAAAVAIIVEKFHLLGSDSSLSELLLEYVRHVSVYQALRATGDARYPKAVGANFPKDLFKSVEKQAKELQAQYDRQIERGSEE